MVINKHENTPTPEELKERLEEGKKKIKETMGAKNVPVEKLKEQLSEGKEKLKETMGVKNPPNPEELKERLEEGKNILKENLGKSDIEDEHADQKQAA
ncbi:MAG: hypothetical protein NT026_02665 [Candidatus Staskawiczbacteria bacterium]|nr:hypothetical protein [Candidatus Staskawiczbacteria bacterium]